MARLFSSSSANPATRPEVVMITGASAGVGRAVVRAYAERDASIGLVARGRAVILQADVADADRLEAAASKLEEAATLQLKSVFERIILVDVKGVLARDPGAALDL
jgi:NADP-dependent 3-hydroxy acid dehydrogenase YdfG